MGGLVGQDATDPTSDYREGKILRDRLPWVTEVVGGVEEMDYEESRAMGAGGYVPKYEY